ncbi:MAG: glycosyltransferase, partial [Thermoprotei archaeon]
TNLYSESVGFGAMVYEALQVARGDVISFLDDDDEFLPGKLKAVYEAFQRGADYYHNGRLVINESGTKLREEGESALISGEEAKRSWARWLLFHAAFHNSSSVSVRRRLLGKELKKIDLTPDAYCFVASLLKGDVIVDDPRPLTLFRVHGDHVGVDLRSREINEVKRSEAGKRRLQDTFYLYGLARETPYEKVVKYFFINEKMAWFSRPRRTQLADPIFDRLSIKDVAAWVSYMPYMSGRLTDFWAQLLLPLLPSWVRELRATFLFKFFAKEAYR